MLDMIQFIDLFRQLENISPAALVPRSKVGNIYLSYCSEYQALYVNSSDPELDNIIIFDERVDPLGLVIIISHEIGHAISIRRKGLHEGRYGEALEALKSKEKRAFKLNEEISAWKESINILNNLTVRLTHHENKPASKRTSVSKREGEPPKTEVKPVETEVDFPKTEVKFAETEVKFVETEVDFSKADTRIGILSTPINSFSFLFLFTLYVIRSIKFALYSYSYDLRSFPAALEIFAPLFNRDRLPLKDEVKVLGSCVDEFLDSVVNSLVAAGF